MRTYITLILLMTLFLNCLSHPYYAYEQPAVISDVPVLTINTEERAEFNLFTGIDDFKEAEFYSVEDGGYVVEIITEDRLYLARNRDSLAIVLLEDYLNRYEEIKGNKVAFEKKWQIVDYDDLGFAITEHELNRFANFGRACLTGSMISGAAGGLILITVLRFLTAGKGADAPTIVASLVSLTVGLSLSVIIGGMMGVHSERKSVLKTIKQTRKPSVMK